MNKKLILIAGPYRSGTDGKQELIEANLARYQGWGQLKQATPDLNNKHLPQRLFTAVKQNIRGKMYIQNITIFHSRTSLLWQ